MTLEKEVPFDFDFSYTPGEPATRDYPGSKPEVEIIKVTLNGVPIPIEAVSGDMYQEMIDQVLEHYY